MRQRVREFAWAGTVLGAIDGWPQALRTVVDVALGCAFLQIVVWGPELIQIYNDAYRELIGAKHPAALGQPTREFWPELWPINGPLFDRVLKGESVSFKDARYEFQRHDEMEVAYFSASYSPIRGDDGLVRGVLCTLLETTLGVRAEEMQADRERLLRELQVERSRLEVVLPTPAARSRCSARPRRMWCT